VTRLPIAPQPQPDEALSSWIARIAARYDLAADDLVRYLLPYETDVSGIAQWIDVCPWPLLEDALAAATNRPRAHFARQRLAGLAVNPDVAWPRSTPAWCPLCIARDVAAFGEVYSRKAWMFGGYLICAQHRCLLIASCPLCLCHVAHRPVNGRLRLWCEQCDRCADNALAPRRIPFWPFGTPQQHGRCVTIRLTAEARPLLLQVQSDLLAALRGAESKEPWARGLQPAHFFAVLRRLSFVMLGPLWEGSYRLQQRCRSGGPSWSLPDGWTPGSLPPEIAAPALLASVTFLAAERRTRLEGITWNPRLLLAGEGERIEAATLIWHLNSTDAEWVRRLFGSPVVRPFAVLLAALRGNHRSLGAMREAARRRQGVGGAERRIRDKERRRATETEAARMERERREQRASSSQRFAIGRLIDGYVAPAKPRLSRTQIEASFAVCAMRGAGTNADGVPAGCDDTLLGNRYIRLWLARHRHVPAPQLIATLVAALETARSHELGLVLPELPATMPAPL
jgi:hypothetical protein